MHALLLESQHSGSTVVLKAAGEIDLHNQDDFERAVGELLETSAVVVDLSGVNFFAISALRSLIVCHRLAAAKGRELFYAEPSRQLLRLLTVSGLLDSLPVRSPLGGMVATG